MKKWWLRYSVAGLVFGALFWHYFNGLGHLWGAVTVDVDNNWFLSAVFLMLFLFIILGVWALPAILPGLVEYRRSQSRRSAVLAAMVACVSAVLGYYVYYVLLLALFGLPHMDHLLVWQANSGTFWQEWAAIFPSLIVADFLKWTAVSLIGSGLAGGVGVWLYSAWVERRRVGQLAG